MNKIDYRKILNHLIEEYPHKINKIKEVVEIAEKNAKEYIQLPFEKIINNRDWNSQEKEELLVYFQYDTEEHELPYYDKNNKNAKMNAIFHTIKYDNISGFEALMATFKNIKNHYYGIILTKDEALRDITQAICNIKDLKKREKYMQIVLKYLTEEDKKRLMAPYYTGSSLLGIKDESIFIDVIRTKSITLIEENSKYVDNLNPYFTYAIETEDINIVDWFINHGVNLNYCHPDLITGALTPLKKAIQLNNYELFIHLIESGAAPDLKVIAPNYLNQIINPLISIYDRFDCLDREKGEIKEDNEYVQTLRFIRESTPLEYASILDANYKDSNESNQFQVNFKGSTNSNPHRIKTDIYKIPETFKIRAKIVDYLFDYLKNSPNTTINNHITDILGVSIMVQDLNLFKKYREYAKSNNLKIDYTYLINLFLSFVNWNNTELFDTFLDFIKEDTNLLVTFFNKYFFNNHWSVTYHHDEISEKILKLIPKKERVKIPLVPCCRSLNDLNELINMGFSIKQEDELGENILFKIIRNEEVHSPINDLFDYLLEKIDLTHKNKEGKDVLYYGLKCFDTKDENFRGSLEPRPLSEQEVLVTKLIKKMKPEDVITPEHIEVLEKRLRYSDNAGGKMHMQYVYLHHKDLWEALIDKGLKMPESILNEIFTSIYSKDEKEIKVTYASDNFDPLSTLDFIYSTLDWDTKIQNISIEEVYRNICMEINNTERLSLERFKELLSSLYATVRSLVYDYKKHVKKKYRPKYYEEYVYMRHNVTYHNLDSYITRLLIKGLRLFGTEAIDELLALVPKYDINTILKDEDIGYSYWTHLGDVNEFLGVDEDGNEIYNSDRYEAEGLSTNWNQDIMFYGGLAQYGILINDLDFVKKLVAKGAKLDITIDDENHTWDYVNSNSMHSYIDSIVGPREHQDLDEEERKYFLSLIGKENKNENENT